MKRQHTLLTLCAVLMTFAFGSCQKDNLAGSTFTATLERYADINTKTYLDGNRLKWDASDHIIVLNDNMNFGIYAANNGGEVTTDFTYVANASGTGMDIDVGNPGASCYTDGYPEANFFQAIYPAEIVDIQSGGVNLPATYNSPDGNLHGFPMYAYSTNNRLNFKNAFGLIKLTMQKANTTITSISVTADQPINGLFVIDNSEEWTLGQVDVPPLAYSSGGTNTTTLTLGDGGAGISIATEQDFYICLPPGDYSSLTFTFTNNEGGYCTLGKNTSTTIVRSQYTAFDLRDNDPADELLVFTEEQPTGPGVLNGYFSVSPTTQVQFSKGNLQFNTVIRRWKFAETQWEYIGQDNVNPNLHPRCIDLFGWGTGSNPTLLSGDPQQYTWSEWGNNLIFNGTGNTWRTLTIDEWTYLLLRTDNSGNLKVGEGTIDNSISVLVLLPDNWNLPNGCDFTPLLYLENQFGTDFNYPSGTVENPSNPNVNFYTISQAMAMQEAGAVFLPMAGERITIDPSTATEIDITDIDIDLSQYPYGLYFNGAFDGTSGGTYWSCTPDAEDANKAHMFSFNDAGEQIITVTWPDTHPAVIHQYPISLRSQSKPIGASVRLVCEVTNSNK